MYLCAGTSEILIKSLALTLNVHLFAIGVAVPESSEAPDVAFGAADDVHSPVIGNTVRHGAC